MSDIFSLKLFREHPYVTGLGVVLGGVGLWYFFLGGNQSGGGTVVVSQPGQSDADYQQAQQIAGQLAMAQLSAQTQLALQTQQLQVKTVEDQYGFQLAQIQLENQATATTGQLQLQEDALNTQRVMQEDALNTQLEEQQAGYDAQIQGMKITANSAIAQTTINANLQQNLAAISAQLQAKAIQSQSDNFQAQLSASEIINGQNVSAVKNGQDDSMWGSVIGTAAMVALAFL
jgi:hypothetical protein